MAETMVESTTTPDLIRVQQLFRNCRDLPKPLTIRQLLIAEALRRCGGNCSAAARMLGMTPQAISAQVRKMKLVRVP